MASASSTSSLLQRVRERRAEAERLRQASSAAATEPSVALNGPDTKVVLKETLERKATKVLAASSSSGANSSLGKTKSSKVQSKPSKSDLPPPTKPKDDMLEGRVTWRDPFARDPKELPSQTS